MSYQYEPLNDEYQFQEFLKDLFNNIHNTNSFEEYGTKGNAQHGVDVYCPTLKIAIQAKKKDNSRSSKIVRNELILDLKETVSAIVDFPHPVETIYFATTTPKFIEVQNEALSQTALSGKSVVFYSWNDLQKEISRYPDLRQKYYPHLNNSVLPQELVSIPQIDTTSVLGREGEISQMTDVLKHSRALVIQSIGGIGKSTLARLFYQSKITEYDFMLWLDCNSDYKKDLVYNESLIDNLQVVWEAEDSDGKRYEKIINRLNALSGKTLIVLDNLQHASDISVETEVNKLLSNGRIDIVITSKQSLNNFPVLELSPVDIDIARDIFIRNCPKEIDLDGLHDLILLVESNTLLVELIAKTIYNDFGLTIRRVIDIIMEGTVEENLQIEIAQVSNGESLVAPLYNHLLKVFDLNKLDRTYETFIVLLMSVLPASFISIEDIFSVFLYNELHRYKVINAINTLHKRGIVTRNGDEIRMHKMIQDVTRIQLPAFVVYLSILNSIAHSILWANNSFSNKGYRIALYAESILSKLVGAKASGIQQPLLLIKNNLYIMYRYLGKDDSANKTIIEIINHPGLAYVLDNSNTRFAQTLNHNIGTFYFDAGDFDTSEKYFEKVISFDDEELNIDRINSYTGLFNIKYLQRKFEDAVKYSKLALEYYEKFPRDQHDDVFANLLNNFAIISSDAGNYDHATFHITWALKIYREYNGEKKNDGMLAMIYSNAADIFSKVGNHEVAILFVLHAIAYQSKLKLERDKRLLTYYKQAIMIHNDAGEVDIAEQYKEVAIRFEQSIMN